MFYVLYTRSKKWKRRGDSLLEVYTDQGHTTGYTYVRTENSTDEDLIYGTHLPSSNVLDSVYEGAIDFSMAMYVQYLRTGDTILLGDFNGDLSKHLIDHVFVHEDYLPCVTGQMINSSVPVSVSDHLPKRVYFNDVGSSKILWWWREESKRRWLGSLDVITIQAYIDKQALVNLFGKPCLYGRDVYFKQLFTGRLTPRYWRERYTSGIYWHRYRIPFIPVGLKQFSVYCATKVVSITPFFKCKQFRVNVERWRSGVE